MHLSYCLEEMKEKVKNLSDMLLIICIINLNETDYLNCVLLNTIYLEVKIIKVCKKNMLLCEIFVCFHLF